MVKTKNVISNLGSGAIYLAVSSLILMLSGYITNLWLARFLGPIQYGNYGVIISLLTTINLIQTSGLPMAISKYVSENNKVADLILRKGLLFQITSTLVITYIYFNLAYPIANLLNDLSLIPYLQLSSLILPCYGIFALYIGFYNGLHKFTKQALANIVYAVAKVLLIIGLASYFGLAGIIFGFIIAPIVVFPVIIKIPSNSKKQGISYKSIIMVGIPLSLLAFTTNLQQSLDLFFLKKLLPVDMGIGYYSANQNIAKILFFALTAFSSVLFPAIARNLSQNLMENSRRLIRTFLRIILIILVPTSVLISSTSKELIDLVYSSLYLPGATSLSILIVGFAFLTLFMALTNILNGAGMFKVSLYISTITSLITAVLCFLLIPIADLEGAALATTVGSFISMSCAAFFVYRKFNTLVPVISLFRICFAALLLSILIWSSIFSVIWLPILYLIYLGFYFSVLYLIKEITSDDIFLIKKRFRTSSNKQQVL